MPCLTLYYTCYIMVMPCLTLYYTCYITVMPCLTLYYTYDITGIEINGRQLGDQILLCSRPVGK